MEAGYANAVFAVSSRTRGVERKVERARDIV
jgi:hypothetical protein